jgi:hypothetical protein
LVPHRILTGGNRENRELCFLEICKKWSLMGELHWSRKEAQQEETKRTAEVESG